MTMTYAQPITRRATRNRPAVPALWRQVVRGAAKDEQTAPAEPDRSAYTQLEIYEGVLTAFDRRTDVLRTIEASSDRLTAAFRIRRLLGRQPVAGDRDPRAADAGLQHRVPRPRGAPRRRAPGRAGPLKHSLPGNPQRNH